MTGLVSEDDVKKIRETTKDDFYRFVFVQALRERIELEDAIEMVKKVN